MISAIYDAFILGGFWMYPILIVQVLTYAIIAERLMALFASRAPNAKNRARVFEEDIKKGQLEKIISKIDRNSSTDVVSLLARTGAESVMHSAGKEEIQLKMEELVLEESGRIDKRIGYLPMLANVATLLGLLGTIVGLIRSFSSISALDEAEKAQLLAAGISEAMNATAYGLIVAVPALVCFAFLQSRANTLTEDLQKAALKMFIWFGFNVESQVRANK
jgi:biopolymer transport protein ExbB